jgi:hypothetical protein
MYNPGVGRFLQRDPLIYLDGPGLYQYVRSNPAVGTDPTGLGVFKCQCKDPLGPIIEGYAEGNDTIIDHDASGVAIDRVRRSGGTRAWRNNNPGNIRNTEFAKKRGSIGTGPGGFAIFPDEASGARALGDLLKTSTYSNLTLDQAINRYAPPSDNNDTANYQKIVRQEVGVDGSAILNTLTPAQMDGMIRAIRRVEGWREGTVTCEVEVG